MIINGGMVISQRGTSAKTIVDGYYTVDRWAAYENTGGTFTNNQLSMSVADKGITGHPYALQLDCTVIDASIGAAEKGYFAQRIEGNNLQHLRYGSSSAKNLMLSFWVKSNKTGIYCVTIHKPDTTAYYLPIEYTIVAADTWEQKTISISPTAGSTSLITGAGGIIGKDTGVGMEVLCQIGDRKTLAHTLGVYHNESFAMDVWFIYTI